MDLGLAGAQRGIVAAGRVVGAMRDLLGDLEGALRLAAHEDRGALGGGLRLGHRALVAPPGRCDERGDRHQHGAPQHRAQPRLQRRVEAGSGVVRGGRAGTACAQVRDEADEDRHEAECADVQRPVGGVQRRRDARHGDHQRGRERDEQASPDSPQRRSQHDGRIGQQERQPVAQHRLQQRTQRDGHDRRGQRQRPARQRRSAFSRGFGRARRRRHGAISADGDGAMLAVQAVGCGKPSTCASPRRRKPCEMSRWRRGGSA